MNEQWNTMNLSMLRPNGKGKDEVSLSDINKLLKGRSFEQTPLSYQDVPQYDQKDVLALEQFCRENGILGVNFGKMNPRAALNMLKGKMGVRNEPTLKRGLING